MRGRGSREGVEARPYGVVGRHPELTDAGLNPSVTAQRAATAPLAGEPRGGWRQLPLRICLPRCRNLRFAPTVGGGVLDAPRLRDYRGGLGASARADRFYPRCKRCVRLASATQRMQSRASQPAHLLRGGRAELNPPAGVGLSMMCYTLGKANKTCLGERQERGRMGKLL